MNATWHDKIFVAQSHVELDEIVTEYLASIGAQAGEHSHETYEDTAERLNNNVMTHAAQKWHALNEE